MGTTSSVLRNWFKALVAPWKKLDLAISTFRSHCKLTDAECGFRQYFLSKTGKPCSGKDIVLIQCVEDTFYMGIFGVIATMLYKDKSVCIEQYLPNSLRPNESRSLYVFLYNRLLNAILNLKWSRLHKSFCNGVGYRSAGVLHPLEDVFALMASYRVWKKLETKDGLVGLSIDQIYVGDLVNDSYLRYKPAHTVELKDLYLLWVIWQTYRDIRKAKAYFSKKRPKWYLTSHSGYIQHGVAVRVALLSGTRVLCFGNRLQFAKELVANDVSAMKNPDAYKDDFLALDNQEARLNEAAVALDARLSGVIDRATSYMKQSAYHESGALVPDVNGAAVLFLHCFFDCPHGYRGMLFPDFWEWACFTIESLEASGAKYFVKPHPGWLPESNSVFDMLLKRYPGLPVLSPKVTNKQLAEAGLGCVISVHGTVIHEMAYMGVPSIACGDSPHASFDFGIVAKTKQEYRQALDGFRDILVDKKNLRNQSLMFFYMHNLFLSPEENELLSMVSLLRSQCHNQDNRKSFSNDKLIPILDALDRNMALRDLVKAMDFSAGKCTVD